MNLDEQFHELMRGLLSEDPALIERHIQAWSTAVDMSDLDPRIVRMMPAIQETLLRNHLPIPFPGHLRKYERYWWLNQRWIERSIRPVVQSMLDAGLSVVALKGLAVQAQLSDPRLRTMSDVDLWLPLDQSQQAFDLLFQAGFEVDASAMALWSNHPARFQETHHALPFRHPQWNASVDIHWRLGGLISRKRSQIWWQESLENPCSVPGWPDGMWGMWGIPLVHAVVANGYMDVWSSGMWLLDVQKLTAQWSAGEWLQLRAVFEDDGRLFMWNWAIQSLLAFGCRLPAQVVWVGGAGPERRWRRMVYRNHWESEARGVLSWTSVRPIRTAIRMTRLHARRENVLGQLRMFWASYRTPWDLGT